MDASLASRRDAPGGSWVAVGSGFMACCPTRWGLVRGSAADEPRQGVWFAQCCRCCGGGPLGEVDCGVEISVEAQSAGIARLEALAQGQFGFHCAAGRAGLGGGRGAVGL